MKVVLTQDVAKIGRRFEVVDVPDGYAFNKLIPHKLALPATPANVKRVTAIKQKSAETLADELQAFKAATQKLDGQNVTVKAGGNAEGKLFESLKAATVVAHVEEALGVSLKENWIQITSPIKTAGEHTILLACGDQQGEFVITIES